jgi:NAD(P)H-flavin reductase
MFQITKKYPLNQDVDALWVLAPFISLNAKPGHFIILRSKDESERIPLTIVDVKDEQILLIVQKVGYSTEELCTLNEGDFILDLVGPLGQAIVVKNVKRLLAVAGGVGAAPLLPQVKEYAAQGTKVDLLIGAKTEDHLILLDEFSHYCRNIYIYTDDGSKGQKGFVTKDINEILQKNSYDHAIVIGPVVMMKSASQITLKHNISTDVSLNPIMIDGTGMCGNCRVSINGKTYFACVDGPDFNAEGIDFDELIARQKYYEKEEHQCRLGLNNR